MKELKKEYEVLRKSSVDSKLYMKNKLASESESNVEENSASSSKLRHTHKSKKKNGDSIREVQLLMLEKKQLEIIVSNSMKKVEELLHHEIELKKTIHDLKLKVEGHGTSDNEYEFIIKKMKKNEEDLQETIDNNKK